MVLNMELTFFLLRQDVYFFSEFVHEREYMIVFLMGESNACECVANYSDISQF